MSRGNGVWVVLTPYPADLGPLDATLRHMSLTLLHPNEKDLSAW